MNLYVISLSLFHFFAPWDVHPLPRYPSSEIRPFSRGLPTQEKCTHSTSGRFSTKIVKQYKRFHEYS